VAVSSRSKPSNCGPLKDKADSEIVPDRESMSRGAMSSSREAAAPVSGMGPYFCGGLRSGRVCESSSASYAGHTPARVDDGARPGWSTCTAASG
jgi:hypothetical protein